MSSWVWRRLAGAVGCALMTGVALAGPARALPQPQIPPDVSAVLEGAALRQAQSDGDGITGAVRVDDVHEVFHFSPDFVDGLATAEPVTSSGRWIAALVRDDAVLGTVEVAKRPGGVAEPGGFSDDVDIGTALGRVAATELLVVDEPNSAYYAVAGSIVRPLNDWARQVLPEARDLTDTQDVVARQYALSSRPPTDHADSRLPAVSLTAMVVALVIGGVALLRRRNRYSRLGP